MIEKIVEGISERLDGGLAVEFPDGQRIGSGTNTLRGKQALRPWQRLL